MKLHERIQEVLDAHEGEVVPIPRWMLKTWCDMAWVGENTPSREKLQEQVKNNPPPQEWYDYEFDWRTKEWGSLHTPGSLHYIDGEIK